MSEFYKALTWDNTGLAEFHSQKAYRDQLEFAAYHLRRVLEDGGSSALSDIFAELASLPASALTRILRAPELCWQIHSADQLRIKDSLAIFLRNAIAAELQLLGQLKSSAGCWTALGDWQLPVRKANRNPSSGVMLEGGILLDFCSPYANRPVAASSFRPEFSNARVYTRTECNRIARLCQDASARIHACSEPADIFYKKIIQTVMPRVDENSRTFKGSSNPAIVGRVNMYNPHLEYVDAGAISSSLIHESVHTYLFIEEYTYPLFADRDLAHNARLMSSFSGKVVHLLAFVHAVFVWFALLNFWMSAKTPLHYNSTTINYYRRFCLQGFSNKGVEKVLAPWRKHIAERIYMQILAMQHEVRTRYE